MGTDGIHHTSYTDDILEDRKRTSYTAPQTYFNKVGQVAHMAAILFNVTPQMPVRSRVHVNKRNLGVILPANYSTPKKFGGHFAPKFFKILQRKIRVKNASWRGD